MLFVVLLSPKSHNQLVGLSVEESVKLTVRGTCPLVGYPVKDAVGARPVTLIHVTCADTLLPAALVAVRFTE